jgi:predicted ATPase
MALFDPAQHHAVTRQFAAGGAFFGYMITTLYLWFTGNPDQACAHQERVIALAETLSDPYTLTLSLLYEANLGHELGDVDRVWNAVQRADRMLASSDHDFLFLAAIIRIIHGWVLAQKGQVENGIAELIEGLTSLQATGAKILGPYYSAYLAEVMLLAGKADEALPILEQGIQMSDVNLDTFYKPELQRQRAELLWHVRKDEAGAEAVLREAIAISSAQGARSLELKATLSLARLLATQGRQEEAAAALGAIYLQFDEGFDTHDLVAARTLLQELEAKRSDASDHQLGADSAQRSA